MGAVRWCITLHLPPKSCPQNVHFSEHDARAVVRLTASNLDVKLQHIESSWLFDSVQRTLNDEMKCSVVVPTRRAKENLSIFAPHWNYAYTEVRTVLESEYTMSLVNPTSQMYSGANNELVQCKFSSPLSGLGLNLRYVEPHLVNHCTKCSG